MKTKKGGVNNITHAYPNKAKLYEGLHQPNTIQLWTIKKAAIIVNETDKQINDDLLILLKIFRIVFLYMSYLAVNIT